jgi:hypothetical protein
MRRLCDNCLDAYEWPEDETDPHLCARCDAYAWLRRQRRRAYDARYSLTLGKVDLDELRSIVRRLDVLKA